MTNDSIVQNQKYINEKLNNNISVEVASNPEFLSQGTAVEDTLNASRIIIGVKSKYAEEILRKIYKPFNITIVCVNRESSEMIKYASNNFLALKISYINDIANLCEKVGANIDDVVKGMKFDIRIGDKFFNAGIKIFNHNCKITRVGESMYGQTMNLQTLVTNAQVT